VNLVDVVLTVAGTLALFGVIVAGALAVPVARDEAALEALRDGAEPGPDAEPVVQLLAAWRDQTRP
jgi:hypothetical protein